MTSDRFARHNSKMQGALCDLCGVRDTIRHVLHECPKWCKWRTWKLKPSVNCLAVCGIVPLEAKCDKADLLVYAVGAVKLYQKYHEWQSSGYTATFIPKEAGRSKGHNFARKEYEDLPESGVVAVRRRIHKKRPPTLEELTCETPGRSWIINCH
eukprot:3764789-Amphidinium_carterae.1